MTFELIIFDLDGTLVDSRVDIANSVRYALKELGLPDISPEIIYTFVGHGVEPLIRKSVQEAGGGNIKEALDIFRNHYAEHLTDNAQLFPYVKETLQNLEQLKKVVLTNKLHSFSEKMLEALGIDSFFLDLFGGDSFKSKKPDPEGIRHIIKIFDVLPAKTLIIGDSGVDIEAGKAAGISSCGVTYGYRSKEEIVAAEPNYMVESFSNILSFV